MNNANQEWIMNVFTFPYWLIVDKININKTFTIKKDGAELKFYPPFRTSPANEAFTPQPDKVFFLDGKLRSINPQYKIPKVSMYPLFNDDGLGIKGFQIEEREIWNGNRRDRKDFPVDTIRVDVKGANKISVYKEIKDLMETIRISTNQWWIGHLPYSMDNISITQNVDADGNPTSAPPTVLTPPILVTSFKERIVNTGIWTDSLKSLITNNKPKIYDSLVQDAMYYTMRGDSRRVILDLARALDIAIDINFSRIWIREDMGTAGNYSRKSFIRNIPPESGSSHNSRTYIPLLVSHVTYNKVNGRSFRLEYSNEFENLKEFWDKMRNPVSHGGNVELNPNASTKVINSINKCIKWLEQI